MRTLVPQITNMLEETGPAPSPRQSTKPNLRGSEESMNLLYRIKWENLSNSDLELTIKGSDGNTVNGSVLGPHEVRRSSRTIESTTFSYFEVMFIWDCVTFRPQGPIPRFNGWFGLGNNPLRRLVGRPPPLPEETESLTFLVDVHQRDG